jgi:hypothetical protein
MYLVLHALVVVFCAYEVFRALANSRGQAPRIAMFASLGIVHGLVPILTPRALMWGMASDASVTLAALAALLGIVMFSVGWRIYERSRPDWAGLSPGLQALLDSATGQRLLRRFFWVSMAVSVGAWLVNMIVVAGSVAAAFEAARFEHRVGPYMYFNAIMMHIIHLMIIPGFLGFFLPRRYRLIGIVFTLLMAGLILIQTKGGRGFPMGMMGALVLAYALRHRLTAYRFGLLAAGAAVVFMLAIAMYEVRKVMARASLGEMADMVLSAQTYQGALTRDPLSYHQMLVAAVEHFPRDHDFLNGATYGRLLVFYLPRKHFAWIKPPDTHNTFARVILHDPATLTTIMPTIMGDGYINFWGLPGVVIIMVLNGMLFAFAVRRMRENVLWFLVVGPAFAWFALMAVRGSPYEILTVGMSRIAFVWLLGIVCMFAYRPANLWVRQFNRNVLAAYGSLARQVDQVRGAARPPAFPGRSTP